MKTMRLGKTGLEVSRIGFGGIPIQRLAEVEAIRVVQRCLDLGVTFLDTAIGYTTSEERIGKAIAGRRAPLILATKTPARDRATALEHLEQSLQRLQVDTIDLWQFHNVSTFEALDQVLGPGGALEAAHQAVQAGKVRHIGITSHSMDVALKAVSLGCFETIQFPFNFVTSEPIDRLLPLAWRHNLGFIAMKPLGGGMLSNARLCIKYLLQFDGVLPDPGIQRVEEIEEIAGIVAGSWELTPEEWQEIERIKAEVGTRFCRRCGYCEPCPQGVRISTVMVLESFWKRMPIERMREGWIAEAAASAKNCIECGECEDKCPYHLPIRDMLVENYELYERVLQAGA
ncbi:MAG: aldo/keto reductase [Anaerolineae bacterium]|nr:aldo/keto reductase [Anaerolineae bacterium]